MNRGGSQGFDKHITIFSPQGRLFQVEYAFNASKNFGATCIALKGNDCICAIINKKVTETPEESDLNASFLNLGEYSGAVCTGFPGDHQIQIQDILFEVIDFHKTFYYNIPIEELAKRISNRNQTFTQQAFMRPLGVKTIILGIDEEMGPQLFKCDPSGFYSSHLACAIGEKETEISNYLRKKIKLNSEKPNSSFVTVSNTISILQHVLKTDMKATDITVVLSAKGKYKFQCLKEEEVDRCLAFLGSKIV
mmetsp:Transcript_103241/g.154714  ORF Transcript_103241/g.154714 Transcript_103241/m.154714 type:complete len:250 (-) Transcript_103241:107-856(-)